MSEHKKDCGLARDLMPLSLDGICSESSQKFLDEHMQYCEKCRAAYDKMRGVSEAEAVAREDAASEEQKALAKSVKKTAQRMKRRRWLIILMIPLLIWAALFGYSQVNDHRLTARVPLSMHNYDIKLSAYGQYPFFDLSIYNAPGTYRGTKIDFEIGSVDTENGPVRAALVTLTPQVSPYIEWDYDTYYIFNDNINTADPIFCYVNGGIYTINDQNHAHASAIPRQEQIEGECSFTVGVPVAMITVTDGTNLDVIYHWGDKLPEKNMETLSTVNPYDPWNHLTNSKLLNASMLFDTNVPLPVSSHYSFLSADAFATPVPFDHIPDSSTSTLPPVTFVQSPSSKEQEIVQYIVLNSSPTPITNADEAAINETPILSAPSVSASDPTPTPDPLSIPTESF